MGRIVGTVGAVDGFSALTAVVPTILPVSLGRMVALAGLALEVWCDLGRSDVVALAALALEVDVI